MSKNLTTSLVARNNILNNPYALSQLEVNLLKLYEEIITAEKK